MASNPNGGTAQAVAVVLKFLNDPPEKWHLAPFFLIEQSFEAAFPCGVRQSQHSYAVRLEITSRRSRTSYDAAWR
jgi:hypothetical protein